LKVVDVLIDCRKWRKRIRIITFRIEE